MSQSVTLHLPAYEDGTECSETSAYKIQTPGNYPEENIQQQDLFFVHVRTHSLQITLIYSQKLALMK